MMSIAIAAPGSAPSESAHLFAELLTVTDATRFTNTTGPDEIGGYTCETIAAKDCHGTEMSAEISRDVLTDEVLQELHNAGWEIFTVSDPLIGVAPPIPPMMRRALDNETGPPCRQQLRTHYAENDTSVRLSLFIYPCETPQ
jgi:hypothetical protein